MIAWLLLLAMSAPAPCVALIRPPSFVSEQYEVAYQVRVERHDDHRLLVLVAFDGDLRVRRSDVPLEGSSAIRTHWIRWRLPEGHLTLAAIVYDSRGEVDRDRHQVTVYGRAGF